MTPLIVGSHSDSHVVAILAALREQHSVDALVFDAPTLQSEGFSLDLDRFVFASETVGHGDGGTGWLRRYAPTAWGTGTTIGSLESVSQRAFLSVVGAMSRLGRRTWLTPLDAMLSSEERLSQLYAARALGMRVPDTLVSHSAEEVADRFGERFVVKPIGTGYYWDGGQPRAVFTQTLDAVALSTLDFGAAPFVAQELIHAEAHLRVVTVQDRAWVSELSASDLPIDWRQEPEAHLRWRASQDTDASEFATRLAAAMGVGYSSQDWIRDADGVCFVDLNPGGQWLFLPDDVANPVTNAIADFLAGC